MNPNPFSSCLIDPLTLGLPSGDSVDVPRCRYCFVPWRGDSIADTFGGKAVLDFCGEPVFAELAILKSLQKMGWGGVWVDTYRNKFRQAFAPHCCNLPSHAQKLYDRIREANGGKRSGCFDVFAWNDGRYLFVEAKRKSKDSIRETQKEWIQAVINSGLPMDSLLICEWAFVSDDRSQEPDDELIRRSFDSPTETKEDVAEVFSMVEKLKKDRKKRLN